jgi:flagellar basal-body rod protein FlgB
MILGDTTTQGLAQALRGLEAQQQAHEQNIANVETPGFKAQRASFEASLRRAMQSGNPSQVAVSTTTTTDPTRIDGNNVRLDKELTMLAETALKQQLVTGALNAQYRMVRTAIAR